MSSARETLDGPTDEKREESRNEDAPALVVNRNVRGAE
jgi:hypothetical protein